MIKDLFTWYLIHSHIWLNILKVDRHLFYFLLWIVATYSTSSYGWSPLLATSKNSPKKTALLVSATYCNAAAAAAANRVLLLVSEMRFSLKIWQLFCVFFPRKLLSIIRTGLFLVASVLQIAPKINYEIIYIIGADFVTWRVVVETSADGVVDMNTRRDTGRRSSSTSSRGGLFLLRRLGGFFVGEKGLGLCGCVV